MIRVLHVISAPAAGGAETYVRDLAKAQKAAGYDAHIAFLGSVADLDDTSSFEVDYLVKLDEAGIRYFFIGNDCRRNLIKGMWRVTRYCRQHSITHYHSHLIYGIIFGAFLGVPRLFTEHNQKIRGTAVLRQMLNYFFEGYIAISKNCAITANEIVGQSPTIIFNGVDTSRILTNVRRGQSSGPWKIIAVGRIGPQKNFSLLVEALALLELLIDDDYIVEVAGPGTPKDLAAIEAQAEKAGIAHRVCFLGTVADVANLMKSSDLLVMSSAWEGLPIVLLEAVTARLPFIATDVGGCGEIVEMTGAGLIVPVNDADALAKAILELLTEHSRRDEMRDAAANCSALFSIERSAADHLELYKQTVRSRL